MKSKRIPTIVGIILVVGLVVGLVLLRRSVVLQSGASSQIEPQDIRETNTTNDSVVISWKTDKETTGQVKLLWEGREKTFSDFRDTPGKMGDYQTHYISLEGLRSDYQYQFTIISGSKEFFQSGTSPYSFETASSLIGEIPRANLASGIILEAQSQPAEGAIVYLEIEGIGPLSSLVTSRGNWAISLAKAFSADQQRLANYQEGLILERIFVQGNNEKTATARIYTKDDDPVPPITLGQDYDFTQNGDTGSSENNLTPTPTFGPSKLDGQAGDVSSNQKEFEIGNPEDGETITFPRPEIFGSGPEGGKVKITIESPVKHEADLTIDYNGDWSWAPPQDLEPGAHTLTVEYINPETGEKETFVRTFVLAANTTTDDLPSFSATPSGDLVTPTSMPTASPSATPTLTITATPVASSTPTAVARKTQPSTESGVPQSGFWQPTFILFGSSLIVFLSLLLGWL